MKKRLQWLSDVTQMPVKLMGLMTLVSLGSLLVLLSYSSTGFLGSANDHEATKYLYWGDRIDCPGKHCELCAGLGHQESSLRCALEEAMVLGRWGIVKCSMESLYDMDMISQTVRVILDNSIEWERAWSRAQGLKSYQNVRNVSRSELMNDPKYKKASIIHRTANPLAWFMECRDRKNHSAVLLPYSFLPTMASKTLRLAAEMIMTKLGDYDAIHVRRGDVLKLRKDRFGVTRTVFPHLDRDTQAAAIMRRVAKWIPEGRTLFIASNERKQGFFDALKSKYKVVFISHFQSILDPVIQNNYQLFMVERLILFRAKNYVKTFKEFPWDMSLTDDKKKKAGLWQIPVYTFDESPPPS